jgi:hypothetical protein
LHGVSERIEPATARRQLEEAALAIGATAALLAWHRFVK